MRSFLRCSDGELALNRHSSRRHRECSVASHVLIAPGVELQISPEDAGLEPEQVRALVRAVMKVYQDLQDKSR